MACGGNGRDWGAGSAGLGVSVLTELVEMSCFWVMGMAEVI